MNKTEPAKNYKVHIAIFILALIFWFMVKMNKEYDYTITIPLRVINNNLETWLQKPPPEDARVEFTGRGIDLIQLGFTQSSYDIDLSGETNTFTFNLTEHREFVRKPRGVDVVVKSVISPIEIQFELDARREQRVAVVVNADLKTENGFILVNAIASPDSVQITGPASYVDTLSYLRTQYKEYSGINLAFEDRFNIQKDTPFYTRYEPGAVKIFFDVQRLAEKEITDVPVVIENVPDYLQAVPLPSKVRIYINGGEKVLAEVCTKLPIKKLEKYML